MNNSLALNAYLIKTEVGKFILKNLDVAMDDAGWMGLGVVLRASTSKIRVALAFPLRSHLDVFDVESLELVEGLRHLERFFTSHVMLESDTKQVVGAVLFITFFKSVFFIYG